jgi:hypothetical protein
MRGLLTPNAFQFPARPPSLNLRHPLVAGGALRMAPVATGRGMTDLRTGFYATNTNLLSVGTNSGPMVVPLTGTNSNYASLSFPVIHPSESLPNLTIAAIIQPMVLGGGQGVITLDASTGGGFKLQTTSIGITLAIATVNVFGNTQTKIGHTYFAAATRSSNNRYSAVILDMTSGVMYQYLNASNTTVPTAGATAYSMVTYNAGTNVDAGRVAAGVISAKALSPGELLAMAADPYSLWYDPSARNLLYSAGSVSAGGIIIPPPTGGLLSNPFSYVAQATTNATNVAPRPCMLTGWSMINTSASPRFVRFYNKASAPAPATDNALIVARFPIPAGGRVDAQLGSNAAWFSAGLGFDITGAAADTDVTATVAGDVTVNLFWE